MGNGAGVKSDGCVWTVGEDRDGSGLWLSCRSELNRENGDRSTDSWEAVRAGPSISTAPPAPLSVLIPSPCEAVLHVCGHVCLADSSLWETHVMDRGIGWMLRLGRK